MILKFLYGNIKTTFEESSDIRSETQWEFFWYLTKKILLVADLATLRDSFKLACKYSRLCVPTACRVGEGETSAPERQKFHTDDAILKWVILYNQN